MSICYGFRVTLLYIVLRVQSISLNSGQKGTSQRWFPVIRPLLGQFGEGLVFPVAFFA